MVCGVLFWAGLTICLAQANSTTPDMRPGATIVVKQDSSGSELVNISMFDANYPTLLLQQQIANLGPEVGTAPRGVAIFTQSFGPQPDQKLVKAQFAINGIINRIRREVKLQALVRMFAGAPSPYTIGAVKIILDGEVPNDRTIRTFANEGVVVDGTVSSSPPAIEYLVQLKTQEPLKIEIPLNHQPVVFAPAEKPAATPPMTNLLIALIVLASVAAGALVYFLMVGRGANRPSR